MTHDGWDQVRKTPLVSRTVECVKQGNLSVNFRDSRTRRFVKYKFADTPL
jgi:hypothetical protein